MTTTIIAIDPSLSATGLCVWRRDVPLYLGTIRTQPMAHINGWDRPARIDRIVTDIMAFVDEPTRTIVTMEERIKPSNEAMKGMSTLDLAELRGALTVALFKQWIPMNHVHPSTLKAFAQAGKVRKMDMVAAARTVLGTHHTVHNDNEADAFWLLAMTLQAYGFPVVARTPRRVNFGGKVQWHHFNMREA